MTKELKKIIFIFVLYFAFVTFSHGFYAYYFLSIAKIPTSVYTIGKSFWFLSVFILEIPSGYLSDKFGQKKIFFISMIFSLLAYTLFINAKINYLYFLGEISWGIGNALASGTIEAMIYNRLSDQKIFTKLETLLTTIQLTNVILGMLVLEKVFNLVWVIPITGLIITMSLAIVMLPKKEKSLYTINFKSDIIQIITKLKDITFLYFICWITLIMSFAQIIFNYWQQWMSIITHNQILLAFLSVLIFLTQMIGNLLAKKIKSLKILIVMTAIIFIVPIIANYNIYSLLFAIYLSQILRGIISPNLNYHLNTKIENSYRSTFISVSSMITNIGSYLTLVLIVPQLLKKGSISIFRNSWLFGLVLVVIMFILSIIQKVKTK